MVWAEVAGDTTSDPTATHIVPFHAAAFPELKNPVVADGEAGGDVNVVKEESARKIVRCDAPAPVAVLPRRTQYVPFHATALK
jgi:hypothetical protein